ncbi:MAG: hypothetical protein LBL59_10875 [Xanthomonadaceae bacterium]|nr:hypothetical protein [Xanthomonadaceae bacterium]
MKTRFQPKQRARRGIAATGGLLLAVSSSLAMAAPSAEKAGQMLNLIMPSDMIRNSIQRSVDEGPAFHNLTAEQKQCAIRSLQSKTENYMRQEWIGRLFDNDAPIDQWLRFSQTEGGRVFIRYMHDTMRAGSDHASVSTAALDALSDAQKGNVQQFMESPAGQAIANNPPIIQPEQAARFGGDMAKECGLPLAASP